MNPVLNMFVALMVGASGHADEPQKHPPPLTMSLEVSSEGNAAGAGSQSLRITLKNQSAAAILIILTSPVAEFEFSVLHPDGTPVPKTSLGEQREEAQRQILTHVARHVIKSGESLPFEIDLSLYYELQPGRYLAHAKFRGTAADASGGRKNSSGERLQVPEQSVAFEVRAPDSPK